MAEKLKTYWKQNRSRVGVDEKVDGRYRQEYLAFVALRDLYYNAGIYKFSTSLELGGGDIPIEKAAREAQEIFNNSDWMLADARPEERAPLAKNLYAKEMTSFRYARVIDVKNTSKGEMSTKEIFKKIAVGEREGKILNLSSPEAKAAYKEFKEFLELTDDPGAHYPWKRHVSQARKCTENVSGMSYGCLKGG